MAFACRLGNHSLSSPAAKSLFAGSKAGLVFVTAFHDRHKMMKYLDGISWETEVWVAESPTRLIHFNGERFLGPYEEEG